MEAQTIKFDLSGNIPKATMSVPVNRMTAPLPIVTADEHSRANAAWAAFNPMPTPDEIEAQIDEINAGRLAEGAPEFSAKIREEFRTQHGRRQGMLKLVRRDDEQRRHDAERAEKKAVEADEEKAKRLERLKACSVDLNNPPPERVFSKTRQSVSEGSIF